MGTRRGEDPVGLVLWPLLRIPVPLQEAGGHYQWAARDTAQLSSMTLHRSSLDLVLMSQFAQGR